MMSSDLTPRQIEVLNDNTFTSLRNGFAPKYHSVIEEDFESAEWYTKELEAEGRAESAEEWKGYSLDLGRALMAEFPLVFFIDPSNASESVFAGKLNIETGKIIEHSVVYVGVGRIAGEGTAHNRFGNELLDFAIRSIDSQNETGLENIH